MEMRHAPAVSLARDGYRRRGNEPSSLRQVLGGRSTHLQHHHDLAVAAAQKSEQFVARQQRSHPTQPNSRYSQAPHTKSEFGLHGPAPYQQELSNSSAGETRYISKWTERKKPEASNSDAYLLSWMAPNRPDIALLKTEEFFELHMGLKGLERRRKEDSHHSEGDEETIKNPAPADTHKVWKVARATSAAPAFFIPVTRGKILSPHQSFQQPALKSPSYEQQSAHMRNDSVNFPAPPTGPPPLQVPKGSVTLKIPAEISDPMGKARFGNLKSGLFMSDTISEDIRDDNATRKRRLCALLPGATIVTGLPPKHNHRQPGRRTSVEEESPRGRERSGIQMTPKQMAAIQWGMNVNLQPHLLHQQQMMQSQAQHQALTTSELGKLGACQNCRARLAKCDKGYPCRACINYYKGGLIHHPCRDPDVGPRIRRDERSEQTDVDYFSEQSFGERQDFRRYLREKMTADGIWTCTNCRASNFIAITPDACPVCGTYK